MKVVGFCAASAFATPKLVPSSSRLPFSSTRLSIDSRQLRRSCRLSIDNLVELKGSCEEEGTSFGVLTTVCSVARPSPASPLRLFDQNGQLTRVLAIAGTAALISLPVFPRPAEAARDVGADLFEANCAACHAGGGNVIGFARNKTLKSKALAKYGYDSKDSIVALLREGKSVMPPYGKDKLTDAEVGDVAEFVLSAAQRKWK